MKSCPQACGIVLTLRSLHLTETTWNSFWVKINRYGIPEMKRFGKKPRKGNNSMKS